MKLKNMIGYVLCALTIMCSFSCKKEIKGEASKSEAELNYDPETAMKMKEVEKAIEAFEGGISARVSIGENTDFVGYDTLRDECNLVKKLLMRKGEFAQPWAESYLPWAASTIKSKDEEELRWERRHISDMPNWFWGPRAQMIKERCVWYGIKWLPIIYDNGELEELGERVMPYCNSIEDSLARLPYVWGPDSMTLSHILIFKEAYKIRQQELKSGNIYNSRLFPASGLWPSN